MYSSVKITLPDADIEYIDNFYNAKQSALLFSELYRQVTWRHDEIFMFGKQIKLPRLQAWYSDNNLSYRYSNITFESNAFMSVLNQIRHKISDYCQHEFNAVLANLYRNENDSVGWHSDDETELGINPVIASLSLGVERDFQLKHIITKEKKTLVLAPGSLLIMRGTTQHYWQHCIPKRRNSKLPRINLTFRKVLS